MKRIFDTLFSALRAKATSLWNKIRLVFTLSFWQTKVISKLRQFFSKLFDVRPRDKRDYYPMFRWLVSKRLAYAIVVALSVVCLLILWQIGSGWIAKDGGGDPTYRYNSIVLKFYSGRARVTAHDGYVAYIGDVKKGVAEGQGALYNANNDLVYEGAFSGSKYNGTGTLYYPGEGVRYVGTFVDNEYSGTGKEYRASGVLEYEGEYSQGKRAGAGKLFNASGNAIYAGNFRSGDIVYDELLGKTMAEVAQMYTGMQTLYSYDTESCIDMQEIGVVCGLKDGSDSLEPEWSVSTVFIPATEIVLDNVTCATVTEVANQLGITEYEGETPVLLAEAVTINSLTEDSALRFEKVDMQTDSSFEEAVNVTGYDQNYPVYIHSFEREGMVYTFYTNEENGDRFDFYSISLAE